MNPKARGGRGRRWEEALTGGRSRRETQGQLGRGPGAYHCEPLWAAWLICDFLAVVLPTPACNPWETAWGALSGPRSSGRSVYHELSAPGLSPIPSSYLSARVLPTSSWPCIQLRWAWGLASGAGLDPSVSPTVAFFHFGNANEARSVASCLGMPSHAGRSPYKACRTAPGHAPACKTTYTLIDAQTDTNDDSTNTLAHQRADHPSRSCRRF